MECPRCGTTNDNARQFCSKCGTPIASNMLDPIDFGKTQANPVIVEPIEPMPEEEKLKNTSIIPVVSEDVQAEIQIDLEEEKEKELERTAIRESLLKESRKDDLQVEVKQIERVKKPKSSNNKRPVGLILLIVILFLICILGIIYYLLKKDIIPINKNEETTITTTTTTQVNVQLDTELKATSNEVILNSTSHILKYSYEITKTSTGYSPVIKVYLDNNQVSDAIVQNNIYELNDLYTSLLHSNIYTIEEQVIKGSDKDYYYINIFINEKYYVLILNDTSCIYKNVTGMFNTKDPDYIYNNKSSLIKNGQYAYIKERDETSGLEQLSTITNDTVSFIDGEVIGGFWK